MPITTKQATKGLKNFIKASRKLADAFSEVGEDDNSYDAGGLSGDAEEKLAELEAGTVTAGEVVVWLAAAQDRLDNIS